MVKPSQTLSLTFTVAEGSITSSYSWSWIRQHPGKGLEWMGYWSGSPSYNSTFQSHISITADMSKNKFSLQLSSATTEDTAIYYCARGTVITVQLKDIIRHTEIGAAQHHQGALRTTRGHSGPPEHRHQTQERSRTSISGDTSKNQFSLQLRSVTTEDTAVYYCARYTGFPLHSTSQQPPGAGLALFFVAPIFTFSLQEQLRELGISLVKFSQTLFLCCSVSRYSLISYGVSWTYQLPGKRMETVVMIKSSGSTNYDPTLKSQVSITRDISKNKVCLMLRGWRTEDTAMYYCGKHTVRGSQCEPRHKPPCRRGSGPPEGTQDHQGASGSSREGAPWWFHKILAWGLPAEHVGLVRPCHYFKRCCQKHMVTLKEHPEEETRASEGDSIHSCPLFTGVHSQVQLVQSGAEVRKPGA
ncbi:hypothetical protein HPG69_006833 [Diceros bicornis minor]|uniref:Ig-like domain-containing protein n=1 Tax=Diceros bicornis minor TaxID=77932 RepID=A0A7J7EKX7_DICBM|nr:hypothetical protein HPG69_006833 [Diceros bicornis minor]